MTDLLFRDDAYARSCDASVIGINERGGIILDRTVFYATGGGQPGDRGTMHFEGCDGLEIATTVYDADKVQIVHVPSSQDVLPKPGETVRLDLDWQTRHRHMRVHTALHLQCALIPFPVTGGQISADGGRLDFDIDDPDAIDKDELNSQLGRLIAADHPVSSRWISDEELAVNPGLVRTMSVKPPTGSGRVRLVSIGENGEVDLQPCGGTHVRSTGEIGSISISKIEKKGKHNRRIRLVLG